jgi:predicted porin
MTPLRACLLTASLAAAGLAQAQTAPAPAAPPAAKAEDSSLTWKGITLYGIVDVGLQYDTHSAPFSNYFPAGSGSLVQKNNYDSPLGLTPSNLSQSRIGISGNEPIAGDWSGVFRLETTFNPQSGNLADALKSLAVNNGKALTAQTVGVDSSLAGQLFAGAAYAGVSSPTYGSFTFGRNVTLVADGVAKYDPQGASNAFSLIGFSGTAAGGGDTEDRRLDQSLKYAAKYGALHLGALYQFGGASGSTDTGIQFQLGMDYAGFSADAYYFKKYDAVGAVSLSVAQAQALAAACAAPAGPTGAQCFPIGNSVAATISDNETFSIMTQYALSNVPLKLYLAYEHIDFKNPNDPLPAGTETIGGYILAVTNNAAFANQKTLEVFWAGLKYNFNPNLEGTVAYYGYKQNSFATGASAGCSTVANAACSGTEDVASFVLDYRLSKRFDTYAGLMWSEVKDGLANGYLNRSNTASTIGVRFRF